MVLETIAQSRASLIANGQDPPFVVHLPPKRTAHLQAELKWLGVHFGIPLSGYVPFAREDADYEYLGIVLNDVHVYTRLPVR
jgi:hypothetical protein